MSILKRKWWRLVVVHLTVPDYAQAFSYSEEDHANTAFAIAKLEFPALFYKTTLLAMSRPLRRDLSSPEETK